MIFVKYIYYFDISNKNALFKIYFSAARTPASLQPVTVLGTEKHNAQSTNKGNNPINNRVKKQLVFGGKRKSLKRKNKKNNKTKRR